VNRVEFQQLADVRIAEARVLLANQLPDGAYYLAGYAVECGLKACILARVERTGVIFDDKKFLEGCWTHNIETLVKTADLTVQRDKDMGADPGLATNWQLVKDWTETSRYQRKSLTEAQTLYDAITDAVHGVLPWIRIRW
jgi:hypothetical protein